MSKLYATATSCPVSTSQCLHPTKSGCYSNWLYAPNARGGGGGGEAKARNGITVDQLRRVAAHLHGTGDEFETALMWSALTLAYRGLLRVSEYTSTAPAKQLTLGRIHLSANSATVDLPFTKTCQYGQGTKVTVAGTHTFTCPVRPTYATGE